MKRDDSKGRLHRQKQFTLSLLIIVERSVFSVQQMLQLFLYCERILTAYNITKMSSDISVDCN